MYIGHLEVFAVSCKEILPVQATTDRDPVSHFMPFATTYIQANTCKESCLVPTEGLLREALRSHSLCKMSQEQLCE